MEENGSATAATPAVAATSRKAREREPGGVPPALRFLRWLFRNLGPLAPRLSGRLAFWLWFRPTRRRERPDEASLLASAVPLPSSRSRRDLATYSWGDGPVVLLVHGWNSSTAQLAPLITALVSAGYRVVGFDAPAHGRSAGRRTDIHEMAGAIVEVARGLGGVEAVVAHSMGVLACARAMRAGGLSARRVVALAPAVDREIFVDGFARIMRLPAPVVSELGSRVDRFTGGREFWNEAAITAPTLLVYDEEDAFVPAAAVHALRGRWPHTRLLVATAAGHRGVLSDPEVIAAALRFIERSGATPSDET